MLRFSLVVIVLDGLKTDLYNTCHLCVTHSFLRETVLVFPLSRNRGLNGLSSRLIHIRPAITIWFTIYLVFSVHWLTGALSTVTGDQHVSRRYTNRQTMGAFPSLTNC